LRVPEVWRWRKGKLTFHLLGADAKYQRSNRSRVFPFLYADHLQQFLDKSGTVDDTTLVRQFVAWVDAEIKPRLDSGRKNGERIK
jgi:hypothetical protein